MKSNHFLGLLILTVFTLKSLGFTNVSRVNPYKEFRVKSSLIESEGKSSKNNSQKKVRDEGIKLDKEEDKDDSHKTRSYSGCFFSDNATHILIKSIKNVVFSNKPPKFIYLHQLII